MKEQDLKNSILQLAIQGKLVEQRKEEGTAKELIEQIKAEKEKLTKEGKIKKTKPLPEITEDEKPFDIPESWEWVRLGDCVSNKSGASYKKGDLEIKTEKMIRVLRGGNISDLEYFFKDDDVMIDASFVKENLLLCKNTLITPAVTSLQHIGKMARIDKNYDNVVVGGFVLMLIPHINLDSFSEYMLFALSSYYHRSICRTITNKSGQAFYNLSREKLMNVLVPLPPLEEQKRIVAKIEELMPYVEKYDKAYTEVEKLNKKFPEDMQKSILQYAIQGKLVEQREEDGTAEELYQQIQAEKEKLIKEGKIKKTKPLPEITEDEIPFDIPDNWKWVRLGDLCEKIGSGSTPTGGKSVYKESGIKFIRSQNVYNDGLRMEGIAFISEEQNKQGSIVKPRDILLNITGGSIGRCALVPDDFDIANINQHVMIIRNLVIESRFFLHNILNSPYVQSMIMSVQVGVSREGLSAEKLKNFLIPLPPLEEQKRIVAKIEELIPYTKQLVKKID